MTTETRSPLLKDMDTPALRAYLNDVYAVFSNGVNMKVRSAGMRRMARELEIGEAILRQRARTR